MNPVGDDMRKVDLIKDERGTTLIEFAAVLTILLSLTFGMIDFGRYVYAISVVRSAAQEGARAGLVSLGAVESAVEGKMIALDLARSNVTVAQPDAETVEVDVTYEFEFITPFLATAISTNTVVINGSASMAIY